MKKILLILLLTIFFIPKVNAETIVLNITSIPENSYCSTTGCDNSFEEAYNDIIAHYNTNYKDNYPYYVLSYTYAQANKFILHAFKNNYVFEANDSNFRLFFYDSVNIIHSFYDNSYVTTASSSFSAYETVDNNNYYSLIDSNIDLIVSGATYEIQGFYNDSIILEPGTILPTYLELKKYSSWSEFPSVNTNSIEVNLDNYEYVILNLKDYNKKAFETNLKVKGMIGITPVYEYGTVEKSNITDRCNISYDDFTNYRFFVLENDLLNNAVYVVKKCKDNSSFKFDSTLFDITYVTTENVDDPVITFGGKDYHTIPFKQLSNTANKNEEENFVPGANEEFKPFDDITNYISSFWDNLTTFMSLVTKFFNTLPIEIRAIAITTFMTGCTLGLIKIIKS